MSILPALYSKEPMYGVLPDSRLVHNDYIFWHQYWVLIRDCVMGEVMIKSRSTRYLPKMDKQTDEEYQAFLRRAIFYNATKRTIDGLVGAVHLRDPIVDNLPTSLNLDSITRDGQSFLTFSKRITREVIEVGRYGVLVDAPKGGGKPYLCGYVAEDIIDWETRMIDDKEVLTMVMLREFVSKPSEATPFKRDNIQTMRVLYLDDMGIYHQRYYPEGDVSSEVYEETVPTKNGLPLNHIPFIFFGPEDFGADIEKPPILDIALLNIDHYQTYAQLQAGRYYTAMPIWAVYLQGGGTDDVEYTIGPNTVWQLGEHDKVELVEFAGSGLKFLENALVTIEQQIAALGGKFATATRGVAAESETSVEARNRGEASFLQSLLAVMSDGSTKLLRMLADWNGDEWADIKARFVSDATSTYMSAREIRAMESLYKSGLVPLEVIYAVFRDANIIPPTMDLNEFRALLPDMNPQTEQKVMEADKKAQIKRRETVRQERTLKRVDQKIEQENMEKQAEMNAQTPTPSDITE